MHLNLSADEVLTTTRAVRKRLDFDRPVEREVVEECLDIAIQAPTASNGQGYHWVVVTDPEIKKPIAEHYRNNFEMFYGDGGGPSPYPEDDPRTDRLDAVVDSAAYLARRLHEVPVWVIPCLEGRMGEGLPSFLQASLWGSIMPAVWSFMLAARERGAGYGLDHPAPAPGGGGGRAPRHPVRLDDPGRPHPRRLHAGHRLQDGQPGVGRRPNPLGPLVSPGPRERASRRGRRPGRGRRARRAGPSGSP